VYPGTYIYLGEYDKAIDELERRFAAHNAWLPFLNVDPEFDALHGQPRFERLLRKLGFQQREAGTRPRDYNQSL